MKAIGIVWSMLWRATLLAPVFLVFLAAVVATGLFCFFGPGWIVAMAWAGEWMWAGAGLAGWIGSVALWRWKRFCRLLDSTLKTEN